MLHRITRIIWDIHEYYAFHIEMIKCDSLPLDVQEAQWDWLCVYNINTEI